MIVLVVVFGTGITIAVSISWFDHRTRTRALDVLRVYAERGEEPPASVLQALTWVSGWPRKAPPDDATARPAPHAWRLPRARGGQHDLRRRIVRLRLVAPLSDRVRPGTGVIVAILVALFFAASVAAQLVGAYYAPDR